MQIHSQQHLRFPGQKETPCILNLAANLENRHHILRATMMVNGTSIIISHTFYGTYFTFAANYLPTYLHITIDAQKQVVYKYNEVKKLHYKTHLRIITDKLLLEHKNKLR